MPEFLNPDGSGLVGGLNAAGVGQALQLDGSGNLKVTASGGAGSVVNIADPNTPANKAAVDATGALKVSATFSASSLAINDGTTTTQKAAVDAGGNLSVKMGAALPAGSNLVGGVQVIDAAGANKLAIDTSGRLTLVPNQPLNVAQWNGAAPAVTNQVITGDQVRAWIQNGQSFSATTNKQTAAGAINAGFSIFNPAASGKTLLVYSIKYTIGNNSFNTLNLTTSDPAFGSSLTVTNNKAGSSTTSVASATFTNSNVTSAGTINDTIGSASNTMTQVLMNGDYLVIPAGNGLAFYANISGANSWCVSAEWIEY